MSVEVVEKKNCVPFYFLNDREAKFYFASAIVEGTFNYYNIGREVKLVGKPPWDLKNIIKLIHFGEMEKIDSSIILSEKAKSDSLYKKYCGGIEPSDRSIRDYRHIYSHINHFIMNFTLLLGEGLGLTNFNHISVDGTIKLAFNSPYNIIKRKDVRLLIRHYMVEELSKKQIKHLRKTAKDFLYNTKISDDEKINILFEWLDKLELTGQDSLALYDTDARLMKTKDKGQKYKKFAYNIQLATDTQTKLICGVNVVQHPTDHYQIPALLEQTIENIETLPDIVSADNIYATLANLFYLKEHGISARIPTRQQSKKINDKKSDNPYSIDHFIFDKIQNVYICPQKQILTPDGVYNAKVQKGGFHNKVIVYSNHKACKNCPVKSKCTSSKHRTISRYVHPLLYEAEEIMDTPQGQKDYKLRSKTVESHNGTFIRVFNYDRLPIVGLRRVQGLMFRIVAAYNTIRLYNLVWDNHFDLGEVVDFIFKFSLSNVEEE